MGNTNKKSVGNMSEKGAACKFNIFLFVSKRDMTEKVWSPLFQEDKLQKAKGAAQSWETECM